MGNRAHVFVGNVTNTSFERFELFAIDFFGNNFGSADLKFKTFASHSLNQNSQLQFATSSDLHHVGRVSFVQFDRYVSENLFLQTINQVATREVFTVTSGKWRSVDTEGHT